MITVHRNAAHGDVIASTVVADRLIEKGFEVTFSAHPDMHPSLSRHGGISVIQNPNGHADVNLDDAYEKHPQRQAIHFYDLFFSHARHQLLRIGIDIGGPMNSRPHLTVTPEERASVLEKLKCFPRPWVFICPRSHTYTTRQVQDGVWEQAAKGIPGTLFWIGLHPGPKQFFDLFLRHFDQVTQHLALADLLITVDTGPMHVAAALNVPILAIGQSSSPELHLTDQNDFKTISPVLDCLNCQQYVCPVNCWEPPCQKVNPDLIHASAVRILNCKVSCLIPTHKATRERLNRCLEAVLNQVDEIVLTRGRDGVFPTGLLDHPKIRYVTSPKSNLGFGKNVNFGFRHTCGEWVLLLNDDCFVGPDCVAKLKECISPKVGMIAHLLRYPNGTIYFAGRQRRPGDRGCPHIDHGGFIGTFTQPMEMEAVSGTSVLINRKAFYDSGCFDERFHLYAEDDDISLRFRKHGWKLIYTPHASGIHEGNATTGPTGNMNRWIGESSKLMEQLWGKYWDHNRDRIPGNFDYVQ
jgi:GT2 family glycosyltransferase